MVSTKHFITAALVAVSHVNAVPYGGYNSGAQPTEAPSSNNYGSNYGGSNKGSYGGGNSGSYGGGNSGSYGGGNSGSYGGGNMGSYGGGSYGGGNSGSYGGSNNYGNNGGSYSSSMGSYGGGNYGGGNYGGSNDYSTQVDVASSMDSTSTMMDMSTSTMMMDSTSTMYEAATYTTSASYSSATYGSGSSSWNNDGYNNCVQQCMASYGAPPSMYTAPPSGGYGGSSGSGNTITVVVAPAQGILRYVPFAVNASVGDTLRFVWNGSPHTVTKSSQTNVCNVSSDSPFKSGVQNKSFVFDQVVNNTDPTFFYCGVPGHCEKGMFGIINPPSAPDGSASGADAMMAMMVANNSDMAAMMSYTNSMTESVPAASNWGGNIDMSGMDPSTYMVMAQNIMYTRLVLAGNADAIGSDDVFSASPSMTFPSDITQITAANGTSSGSSGYGGAGATAPANVASGTSAAASTPTHTSGSPRATSYSKAVYFVAIAAAFVFVI